NQGATIQDCHLVYPSLIIVMARVASQNLFEILGDDDDIEAKVELSNDTTPTKNETVVVQKHVDRSRASPKESRLRHEYPQFGNSDNRS
ncbi:9893_t:CDS:1, partial [Entrophospora sp. SA101]